MIFNLYNPMGRHIGSSENLMQLCQAHRLPTKPFAQAFNYFKLKEHSHNSFRIVAVGGS